MKENNLIRQASGQTTPKPKTKRELIAEFQLIDDSTVIISDKTNPELVSFLEERFKDVPFCCRNANACRKDGFHMLCCDCREELREQHIKLLQPSAEAIAKHKTLCDEAEHLLDSTFKECDSLTVSKHSVAFEDLLYSRANHRCNPILKMRHKIKELEQCKTLDDFKIRYPSYSNLINDSLDSDNSSPQTQ